MNTDTNITLKDGTNLTLLKEDNILTFTGVFKQSRYEEEVKEIGIAEVLIRIVWYYTPLIALIISILMGIELFFITYMIWGLFGYFFVTELFPTVKMGMATEYEINHDNHDKKKIVRKILIKQKLNISKKDKGLNEVFKCTYGLFAIIAIIAIIEFEIVWMIKFLFILLLLFYIRYIRKMPLNKPPEEEFPEWKYIGHMGANKLILICLIISAVPSLVIHLLSLENILIDLLRLLFL